MSTRHIYKSVATRRDAERGDHATLRALEEEAAAADGRPSRYRDASADGPAGVYPSGAYGKARINYRPGDHVATGFDHTRVGKDGLHYYRLPDEQLDGDGKVLARSDMPTDVDVDGVSVRVETVGVVKVEADFDDDFSPRKSPERSEP